MNTLITAQPADVSEAGVARAPGALTLAKGLDVLTRVAKGDNTLGKMAKSLGVNKSTLHRLATTLVESHFLSLTSHDGYALGTKLLELGFAAQEQIPLTRISREHLLQLSADTGDTVNLGVLNRDEVHYIAKIPSTRRVQVRCVVGERQPLRHTGLGKALLFDETEDGLRQVYQREAALHSYYKYDLKEWLDVMRSYRAEGYALDLDENEDHIRCVAAPIRDRGGAIIAAVSVSSPVQYMTLERIEIIGKYVKDACVEISRAFGYYG